MAKNFHRYGAIDLKSRDLIATGNTIDSVQGAGARVIIDYGLRKKGLLRYALQGFYPVYRELWHVGPMRKMLAQIKKVLYPELIQVKQTD